jgi:tubulin polyglutamylase TTLL5
VNLSPSLNIDSPLDLKIKGNLLKDTFNLVGMRKKKEKDNQKSQGRQSKNTSLKSNQAIIDQLQE